MHSPHTPPPHLQHGLAHPGYPQGLPALPVTFPATATPTTASSTPGNPPVCQNCATSTTPLWRRDESGATLCNACGLFLKLHGRPRPISLKTDVIKSRNRVKSSGQVKRKSSVTEGHPGMHALHHGLVHTPPHNGHLAGPSGNGGNSPPHSPNSSHAYPSPQIAHSMHSHYPGAVHMGPDPALLRPPTAMQHRPGSVPLPTENEPQTMDSLMASNQALRTRVAELDLVNDLFRSRVTELESSETASRRLEGSRREVEMQLRKQLEEMERREIGYLNRIEALERELTAEREAGNMRKKMRVSVTDLLEKPDELRSISKSPATAPSMDEATPEKEVTAEKPLNGQQDGNVERGEEATSAREEPVLSEETSPKVETREDASPKSA
ncbi:GATA zinc finger protein 3 [Saitoella coloradoensis]